MTAFSAPRHTSKDLLFLIPVTLFFLLYALGNGSLASWDEGLYASVAKDVYLTGDWFHFRICGDSWFDKPPLCIWMTALFYKLFGVNEFSARLFSALCGVGIVLVTYSLGRELLNRWTGFWGALVLLSSLHFFRFARFGMTDAPLTFFLSLALYFFWKGQTKTRYLIFSGVALGFAILTKGLAALFVFPIVGLYAGFTGRLDIFKRRSFWIGAAAAFAIALPWFIYQAVVFKGVFLRSAVFGHLWTRMTSAIDGHAGNFYFYVRVLVNKYHPWILVGIGSAPFFLFKAIKDKEEEIIFLTVWMFFIFCAITLIQTKLPWYIYPIYPPLSLSVGYWMAKMFREHYALHVRVFFVILLAIHVPLSHIFEQDYSADMKGIGPIVQKEVPKERMLYLYDAHESPAACFYLGRRTAYLDNKEQWVAALRENGFCALVREANLKELSPDLKKSGLAVLGSFSDLRLVAKKS